jgi:hypothetical protein
VCAPRGNDALLKGGKTITAFRNLLSDPASMLLITLEDLIGCAGPATFGPHNYRTYSGVLTPQNQVVKLWPHRK